MNHITGTAREQITLFPDAIEDYISADNPVRFLDAFVDNLDMATLGFQHASLNQTGRPPYRPEDLLKLYLYGYLNRIRSSRLLERESSRNLEVVWLLKRLSPDHKTISRFRQLHADALRSVFKEFVHLCQRASLLGAELLAIDSTKFTASNARDRVKTPEQLDKSLQAINQSITDYLKQLEQNDQRDDNAQLPSLTKEFLQEKIRQLKDSASDLEEAKKELQENPAKYISLTDPDCRLMNNERRIEAAYSLQTAVDAKHSLIVDYHLCQQAADNNYLSVVAHQAQQMLNRQELTVCADAGYYDCHDLKTCHDSKVTTYLPIAGHKVSHKINVPTPHYYPDKFIYDAHTDTYQCPQGQTLHRFTSTRRTDDQRLIYLYRTSACQHCPVRASCTPSKRGRYIHRWEHQWVLENLKERLRLSPQIIKRRKAIIEHVFGTIKKVWGYSRLLLRTFAKVQAEIALMMTTYNIRRAINILGVATLIEYLHR